MICSNIFIGLHLFLVWVVIFLFSQPLISLYPNRREPIILAWGSVGFSIISFLMVFMTCIGLDYFTKIFWFVYGVSFPIFTLIYFWRGYFLKFYFVVLLYVTFVLAFMFPLGLTYYTLYWENICLLGIMWLNLISFVSILILKRGEINESYLLTSTLLCGFGFLVKSVFDTFTGSAIIFLSSFIILLLVSRIFNLPPKSLEDLKTYIHRPLEDTK